MGGAAVAAGVKPVMAKSYLQRTREAFDHSQVSELYNGYGYNFDKGRMEIRQRIFSEVRGVDMREQQLLRRLDRRVKGRLE